VTGLSPEEKKEEQMACPHEDHDIDVLTIGWCVYCGGDTVKYDPQKTIDAMNEFIDPSRVTPTVGPFWVTGVQDEEDAVPDSIVYSPTQACDFCGEVHPT
jgi:hypothetical protein